MNKINKKFKLKNGLTVIESLQKRTQAVTILALVPAGSRYENKRQAGISHLIEHMLFKGTKHRPSNLIIARELDRVGAEYNAFTSKDFTGYYIKINKQYLELALDVLSDLLFNSVFAIPELIKEKLVVIEEIKMYEDNPSLFLNSLFEKLVFKGSSLGKLIIGNRSNVKQISRQQILAYKKKFYQPNKMILSIAGSFDERKLSQYLKKYFCPNKLSKSILAVNNWKKYQLSGKKFVCQQNNSRFNFYQKKTKQAHLAIGVPAYSYFHPHYYTLKLLTIILGGNMSSRLFSELRVKRGLAYYIYCGTSIYQDIGCLKVQAGLPIKKVNQAIKLILDEFKKIKNLGVDSTELSSAKEFLKGKMILNLEDSANLSVWYGQRLLLTGQANDWQNEVAKINRVSLNDIQAVAKELFNSSLINLVLIGPKQVKQQIDNQLMKSLSK